MRPSDQADNRSLVSWAYFLNPWWRKKFTFWTSMSAAQCRRALADGTTLWLGATVGRALFSAADISLYRVSFLNNGFKPYAHCSFEEEPSGTSVEVTLSMPWLGQIFFGVWMSFAVLINVIATAGAIFPSGAQSGSPFPFSLGFLAFGILLNAFGRVLARRDPEFLLDSIQGRLGTAPVAVS